MKVKIRSPRSQQSNSISFLIFILLNGLTFLIFPFIREFILNFLNPQSTDSSSISHENYLCKDLNSNDYSNKTHSRDVILLYADQFTSGLELALKSLKTTGCKARIVILTSNRKFKTNSKEYLLNTMDISIITGCKEDEEVLAYQNKSKVNVPHMLRFKCERDWLKDNLQDVDRVLHSDAYDIFFQKDPFTYSESRKTMIDYDKLTFVIEPHYIRACGWNLAWFTRCYGVQTTESYSRNFIVCSGTIAGNATLYLQLIELMIHQKEWKTCYLPSHDQPILNYLLWSGEIDRHGIRYKLTGCDGGFATLQWCILNWNVEYNKYGQVILPSKIVPAYLHQYPRHRDLNDHLYQACQVNQNN